MWFIPYVRVRRAVTIYALFLIGVVGVAVALRYWPGVIQIDGRHQSILAAARIDVSMLLAGSAALVGGLATVLGLNLAAENDGHLELAWTKPVSREGYALGVFAVDIAAMAACILLTAAGGGVVYDVYVGHQAIGQGDVPALWSGLAFCGFPLCIYAWITALSASVKRNRGTVAGLFWPLMIALAALEAIRIPAVHAVATALNSVNPIELYFTASSGSQPAIATYLWGWAIGAVLLAAALVQWRRLEI